MDNNEYKACRQMEMLWFQEYNADDNHVGEEIDKKQTHWSNYEKLAYCEVVNNSEVTKKSNR